MKHVEYLHQFVVPGSLEQVFPLLCPVREYDWIDGWACRMVHSDTGVACLNCVFETRLPSSEKMTWVVSRYEPPRCIEFSCFCPEMFVMRLCISLEALEPQSTRLHWTRSFYATSPEGEELLGEPHRKQNDAQSERLRQALAHYLTTGTMLRNAHP